MQGEMFADISNLENYMASCSFARSGLKQNISRTQSRFSVSKIEVFSKLMGLRLICTNELEYYGSLEVIKGDFHNIVVQKIKEIRMRLINIAKEYEARIL